MYLKVQYNNSIKDYTLTDSYNKPYIKVNGSILPLTTNTTQGLHIKINHNNTIYRPLEYNSMSTSDTYYTSAVNSNGLSSTTALTRESTSSTSYLTRSSTSSTSYLTNINIVYSHYQTYNYTYSYNNRKYYDYLTITYTYKAKTTSFEKVILSNSIYNTYSSIGIFSSNGNFINTITVNITYSRKTSDLNGSVSQSSITTSTIYPLFNIKYSGYSIYDNYSFMTGSLTDRVARGAETYTNSNHITFNVSNSEIYYTRSSTYSTVYLTRSSTSGYSGVSSSSSQSSGWL